MSNKAFPYAAPAEGLNEHTMVLTDGTVWNADAGEDLPEGYTYEGSEWEIMNILNLGREHLWSDKVLLPFCVDMGWVVATKCLLELVEEEADGDWGLRSSDAVDGVDGCEPVPADEDWGQEVSELIASLEQNLGACHPAILDALKAHASRVRPRRCLPPSRAMCWSPSS